MTQQTLRAMPGPPECTCIGRGNGCLTCLDTIGYDLEAICPGCPVHAGPSYLEAKRLTAVECWTEHHHADAAWAKAMLQVLMGYRPMTDELNEGLHRQLHETDIWHRFATRPHALEATP